MVNIDIKLSIINDKFQCEPEPFCYTYILQRINEIGVWEDIETKKLDVNKYRQTKLYSYDNSAFVFANETDVFYKPYKYKIMRVVDNFPIDGIYSLREYNIDNFLQKPVYHVHSQNVAIIDSKGYENAEFRNFQCWAGEEIGGGDVSAVRNEPIIFNYDLISTQGEYRIKSVSELDGNPVYYSNTINASDMYIYLYNNTSENIKLDKTLLNSHRITGQLRTDCSITNPIITIEYNGVFNFNYVRIPYFKRYYYITDIVSVRTNIWEISLTVDVLMSFKENILNLNCKILRQEFNYNDYLIDEKLPSEIVNEYEYIWSEYNEDFDSPLWFNMDTKCIAIATSANKVDDNQSHPSMANGSTNIYIVNSRDYNFLSKKIITDNVFSDIGALYQNAGDGIFNITIYPFDLDKVIPTGEAVITNKFQIGLRSIDVVNYTVLSNTNSISIKLCDLTVNGKYNNFLDYSPYCDCEIWLPLIGFSKIDVNKIMNRTISVILDINPISGRGVYRLIRVTDSEILYVFDCVVGINLPVNKSSLNDTVNNLLMTAVKTSSKLVSLGNTQDVSTKTTNKINYNKSGKVSSVTKKTERVKGEKYFDKSQLPNVVSNTTCDIINSLKTHIESGQISSGWENVLLPYEVCVVLRYTKPIFLPNYNHLVGKPSDFDGKLSELTGYTEVGACHMENFPTATTDEVNEIENIIKSGIIL